jgi:hypothetical protein
MRMTLLVAGGEVQSEHHSLHVRKSPRDTRYSRVWAFEKDKGPPLSLIVLEDASIGFYSGCSAIMHEKAFGTSWSTAVSATVYGFAPAHGTMMIRCKGRIALRGVLVNSQPSTVIDWSRRGKKTAKGVTYSRLHRSTTRSIQLSQNSPTTMHTLSVSYARDRPW